MVRGEVPRRCRVGVRFPFMKLSVIIPAYNEALTIEEIIAKVHSTPYVKEIIVVDDGSMDGTRQILETSPGIKPKGVKVIYHDRNQGKGAALRTGFASVTGDIVIIQDADLETDPGDYPILLEPILDGKADVVYGSRFLQGRAGGAPLLLYAGNRFLTLFTNILFGTRLTDMETGYKVFRSRVLDGLTIRSNRFGFEPEFTAKAAKRGLRIAEVPVSYQARTYSQGKKITWKDGIRAIVALLWFRVFD